MGKVLEEKNLNPLTRVPDALARRRWVAANPEARATTRPVFVVGLQRSGTNMLVRGLERAPEVEVYSENDDAAFERYQLRDDETIARIVADSPHRAVIFKPLCDSHRVAHLLDAVHAGTPGRAVWTYRQPVPRARSAVAKFGDANRVVLTRIAAGDDLDRWQAQGLSEERRAELADLDPASLDPLSAAALFWWVRNQLFFDLGLDARDDVRLLSYKRTVAEPGAQIERLCRFLDLPWRPSLAGHIEPRSSPPLGAEPGGDAGVPASSELADRVAERCDALEARLDAWTVDQDAR